MKTSLKIPIYECKVELHICNREQVDIIYKKICKKHKLNFDDISFYGLVIPTFTTYYIILVKEGNFINSWYHELSHCIDFICSDRDIEDSEAKAYLQGLIGEKLHKYII